MTDKILEGLNSEQGQAVTHREGPLLIIAGAGTGKTTVITKRIAWLIKEGLAMTGEILALTFTDKAANSMQEKVDVLVPYGYVDIWISTFHAFGDRLVRENGLDIGLNPDFKVLTRPEAAVFLRENLFKFDLSYYRPLSDPGRFIGALLDVISRAKDEDITPKEYLAYAQSLEEKSKANPQEAALKEEAIKAKEIALCFAKYQELLFKNGKIDFGNQFYMALELLRARPSILRRYQNQFKYILVDEFQDTNYTQFQLVKLLAGGNKNITCVGDSNQCIYKWRGAAYSNILNFMKEYPDCEKIALIQNYRSTQAILDSAYRLIQHNNPERFEIKSNINKRLVSNRPAGPGPVHLHFDTLSTEADNAAKIIDEKVKCGKYKYSDFAILVRANNDAQPFLRSLNMRGIPWRFSGNQGLYSQPEIRLCISFLRLMANIEDSKSLYYLASSSLYKISPEDLSPAMHLSGRRHSSLFHILNNLYRENELNNLISQEARDKISRMLLEIKSFLKLSLEETCGRLLYRFLTDTGFLKSLIRAQTAENEEAVLNLAKFFELVRNFENAANEDRVIYFMNYLDLLIEAGDDPATAEADLDIDAVNVLTLHKAKGLEFEVVFLVSLVMGRFPWPGRHNPIELPDELIKDILPEGDFHIQEERRLFYVGMTRAKKELYLTSANDYGGSRMRKVSRFVLEALGQGETKACAIKSTGLEAIQRHAPAAKMATVPHVGAMDETMTLSLSYYQVDDYQTCPLKYKYVHILKVPIMEHHTVLYGKAMHDAVQHYFRRRMSESEVSPDELQQVFLDSFKKEGFHSIEHLKERTEAGIKGLARFYKEQSPGAETLPDYIEKDFSFVLENTRMAGRWDMIYASGKESKIVDFKTSEVKHQDDADKKARESLQLAVYAFAFRHVFGRLPDTVELHFLESGLIGRYAETEEDLEKAARIIKDVSAGIRAREYFPKPAYLACNYCAYNQICPSAFTYR